MYTLRYLLPLLLFSSISLVQADNHADEHADGKRLYVEKTCMACHGENGNKPIMPAYPKIGGQSAAYAIQQMKDIKEGKRTNGLSAVMIGIMATISDEEIEKIANYLEHVNDNAEGDSGS